MSIEYVPIDNRDPTTAAIHGVLTTLDGTGRKEGSQYEPCEASVSVPDHEPPQDYDQNRKLEGALIEAGVFKTRGNLQRQVLGCLACQAKGECGDWRGIRPTTIAACSEGSSEGVRRVIAKLRTHDLLTTELHHDISERGPRAEWHRLSPEWAAYDDLTQAPPACGLMTDKPNAAAEDLLVELGAIGWRGPLTKAILGCLACRLTAGKEGTYASQIADCQNTLQSSTSAALRALYDADVLWAYDQRRPGERPRVVYRPAKNKAGKKLAELLEEPKQCGLRPRQNKADEATA